MANKYFLRLENGTHEVLQECVIATFADVKTIQDISRMIDPGYAALRKACQDFVDKVDRGEARSVRTYAQMKAALELARK